MVTIVYAIAGLGLIVFLFLLPVLDALALDDWARTTWLRARFRDRAGLDAGLLAEPHRPFGARIYAAALVTIVALFVGALAMPR